MKVACPQCDRELEIEQRPSPTTDVSGTRVEPQVMALRCERCVAWIRLEGWSTWSATHYTMTQFGDSTAALRAFPKGTWFAVADASLGN